MVLYKFNFFQLNFFSSQLNTYVTFWTKQTAARWGEIHDDCDDWTSCYDT